MPGDGDGRRSPLADATAAASMGAAAALTWRLRRLPRPIVVVEESGLRPSELDGVLATIAARVPRLRFALSVQARYSRTRAGRNAALVAFNGFLSVFPALIALNTVLDLVLRDRPDLRRQLVDTAVGSIPVIGDELRVGGSQGSGLALALGLAGALWAGLAAINALQLACNDVWEVIERPTFAVMRLRSIAGLLVVGVALSAGTGAATVASSLDLPLAPLWGIAGSLVINVVGVACSQVVLSPVITFPRAWPGAVLSGALLTALQVAGGLLVTHYLVGASKTYGTFASVIALTSWFGLNAQVVLYGVSLNAERASRSS